jgi:uncharacterized integral membrane protein
MAQITLLLALVLASVLALFGVQNTETVARHFLRFPARSTPLALAVLGGAVIGALLSLLAGLPKPRPACTRWIIVNIALEHG